MDQQADSHKLLRFFKETLSKMPPVAPAELFYDRQCKEIIRELGIYQRSIELLDYGCGNLRLLNGLLNAKEYLPAITYTGTDVNQPDKTARRLLSSPQQFREIADLRKTVSNQFDVIVLMNVIHEIPLFQLANIFEDIRRFLKPDGILLLVDMSILPEGEPLALPFFSWEFTAIFKAYEDKSYTSKTGIPVIFLKIKKSDLYYYPIFLAELTELIQVKRNTFSDIACRLNDPKKLREYRDLLPKLSLSGDEVYDLGKLMLMCGHANYRWMEEQNRKRPDNKQVAEAAIAILKLFFDTFHQSGKNISPDDIFDTLGSDQAYESLSLALYFMSANFGGFFFPITKASSEPLVPAESLEAFQDHYDYDDVKKMGLGLLQNECYEKMYPRY